MNSAPLLTPPAGDPDIRVKTTVFQGYFRIDAYELRHPTFDGGWTEVMRREVFERGHAVAILPYDPVRGEFVMIQQFRIGAYAGGMEPWQIEVAAGIIEAGETAEAVAARETHEETGRVVMELWPMHHYLVSPGGATETTKLYLGRISTEGAGGIFGVATEHEVIRASVVSEAELRALLDGGRLNNAASLIAAQWFFLNRDKVLKKWRA